MYPDQARFVARACALLGYAFSDLDDGNGYLFSVSDGNRHFISGAGWICTYPINTAPAYEVSRDKTHTSRVLSASGIPTIPGSMYFITDHHIKLRAPGREVSDALVHLRSLDFPVFCKPNAGSRGDFAELVDSEAAFLAYIDRVRTKYDAILIQPIVDGDEYRIFCVDDQAYFAAKKAEYKVHGDGRSDVQSLIGAENARLRGSGVSEIDAGSALLVLERMQGLSATDVLDDGAYFTLPGRRNLSAGSEVLDFTTEVPPDLATLALRATRAIGLRVGGVDIFDRSPRRDLSDLVVIEVNGNPAISSLSRLGRDDLIDEIWKHILTAYFALTSDPWRMA